MSESHARIQARLASLRQFLSSCPAWVHGARVVRYSGTDLVTTTDLRLDEAEAQVAGRVGEGLLVEWVCRNEWLYLRVFEVDRPAPSWERVFAEQDMADVRSLLQEEGPDDPDPTRT